MRNAASAGEFREMFYKFTRRLRVSCCEWNGMMQGGIRIKRGLRDCLERVGSCKAVYIKYEPGVLQKRDDKELIESVKMPLENPLSHGRGRSASLRRLADSSRSAGFIAEGSIPWGGGTNSGVGGRVRRGHRSWVWLEIELH